MARGLDAEGVLESPVGCSSCQVQLLSQQCSVGQEKVERLTQEMQRAVEERDSLEVVLKDKDAHIHQLQLLFDSVRGEIETLRAQQQKGEELREDLELALLSAKTELECERSELKGLMATREDLEKKLRMEECRAGDLEQKLTGALQQTADILRAHDAAQGLPSGTEVPASGSDTVGPQANATDMLMELEGARSDLVALRQEKGDVERQLAAGNTRVLQLEEEASVLKEELETIRAEFRHMVTAEEEARQATAEEGMRRVEEMDALRREVQAGLEQQSALQCTIQEYEQQIRREADEKLAVLGELNSIKEQMAGQRGKEDALKKVVLQLQEELANEADGKVNLEEVVGRLESELTQCKRQVATLTTEGDALRGDLADAMAACQQLEVELDTLKHKSDTEYQKSLETRDLLNVEVTMLKEEVASLQKGMRGLEDDRASLTAQVDELIKEKMVYQTELAAAQLLEQERDMALMGMTTAKKVLEDLKLEMSQKGVTAALEISKLQEEVQRLSQGLVTSMMDKQDRALEVQQGDKTTTTPGKRDDPADGGYAYDSSLLGTWQPYVDQYLLQPIDGNQRLRHAAILSPESGIWGCDPDFPTITPQQVDVLVDLLSGSECRLGSFDLGDMKFVVVENESQRGQGKGAGLGSGFPFMWPGGFKKDGKAVKTDQGSSGEGVKVVVGSSDEEGCVVAKTQYALVVGIYTPPMTSKQCTGLVRGLASYLVASGY